MDRGSWIVEPGRDNLEMEVPEMTSMMDLYREGYLAVVFQNVSFLNSKHNGFTLFYPNESKIDQTKFTTECWSATRCGPFKEDAPSNDPAPIGTCVTIRFFSDSDHAVNQFLVSLQLALLCSSTALLFLFTRRNREVVKNEALFRSSLQRFFSVNILELFVTSFECVEL